MSLFMLLGGLGLFVNVQVISKPTYQYFTPGDTTCIKCLADGDRISWSGPTMSDTVDSTHNLSDVYGENNRWKIRAYGNNVRIDPDIPHASRLKLKNMNGTFILTIANTSQEDEGLYVCHVTNKREEVVDEFILLQKRRKPSKITFQNKTGGMVLTVNESESMIINCIENIALPPSRLSLMKNGKIVCNATGHINYTVIPTKDDNNTTFRCTSINTYWNTNISKDVVLDVQFRPSVKFNKITTEWIEGNKVELCCSAYSNPTVLEMTILHGKIPLHTTGNDNTLCHPFKNLTRMNGGYYACLATNLIGQGNSSTEISVMYPPDVTISVSTNANTETSLKCVANGIPANYSYGLWEHRSFFGEHIRYLNSATGQLVLPSTPQEVKYQDSGYYTCNVSNGIRDLQGNLYKKRSLSFESPGPPFLLPGNNQIQNGSKGMKGELQFEFVSYAPTKCLESFPDINAAHETFNITAKTSFHHKPVTVNGLKIVYVFTQLQQVHFQWYRITVCNKYGNLSFEVNFNQVEKPEITDQATSTVIAVVVICLLLIILVPATMFIVVKKRHSQSGSADVSLEMEGGVIPVENRLYSAIQNGQSPNHEVNPSPGSTLLSVETADRSVHSTLSHTTEELGQSVESRLNYADVVFESCTTNQNRIIGHAQEEEEERTVYADVDPALVGSLPDPSSSSSSSNDDFMSLHGIENYMERRGDPFL